MTSHADILDRWVQWREGDADRPLMAQGGNVMVDERHPDRVLSYGRHFTLARDMGDYWLLNGDRYSVSTSKHQGMTRAAISRHSRRESIILPFSALSAAQIEHDSIKPIEVIEDRTIPLHHSADTLDEVPESMRGYPMSDLAPGESRAGVSRDDDGTYRWVTYQHFLGASLFWAETRDGEAGLFLSAFDQQEAQALYFLAKMPEDSNARTVAQAFEDLKPEGVKSAELGGRSVTRQGDVFAYDDGSEFCDRQQGKRRLRKAGAVFERRERPTYMTVTTVIGRERGVLDEPASGGKLVGTDHAATEVATLPDGTQYARGSMYHDVHPRQADHARRKIGDGKTWHRIERNTVPWSQGAPRAFTIRGRID